MEYAAGARDSAMAMAHGPSHLHRAVRQPGAPAAHRRVDPLLHAGALERPRLSLSFASAALERLIDGFWLLAAFLITAAFVRAMPRDLMLGVRVLGVLLLLGAILLFWVVFHKQHAHAVIRESRWASTLRHVIEGLHLMGNPRTMGWTSLISLLYLALQVLTVWALMKGDGLDL